MFHTAFGPKNPVASRPRFASLFPTLFVCALWAGTALLAAAGTTEPRTDKNASGAFWEGRVPSTFEEIGMRQSGATGAAFSFQNFEIELVFLEKQNFQFHIARQGKNLISAPAKITIQPDDEKAAFRGDITGDGKPELIVLGRTGSADSGDLQCAVFKIDEDGQFAKVMHLTSAEHGQPLFVDFNGNGDFEWVHAVRKQVEKATTLTIGALWFTSALDQATPLHLSKERQVKYPKITGGLRYDEEYAVFVDYQARR